MNIFATDPSPQRSAQALDDLRVNKMIIESIQMMSYAIARHSPTNDDLLPLTKSGTHYKVSGSHKKHPCSIWCGNTRGNFTWLLQHTIHLIREKEVRFPKGKSTILYRKCVIKCFRARHIMPSGHREQFMNSSEYKFLLKTDEAYKLTMIQKWSISRNHTSRTKPKWSNTSPPTWASL